jgi:PAS domain S-box-containing protein
MPADPRLSPPVDPEQSIQAYQQLVEDLASRLEECEQTLGAIRRGEIDALVIGDTATAHRVYTLEGADRPFQMLIEQIQEGAVTLSADGTVFYCNNRLAEMLSTPQEQVIGQKLQQFFRADDAEAFRQLLGAAQFDRTSKELTVRSERGVETSVYISLSQMQRDQGEPLLCGVVADLTQQKLHLRELSDANSKLIAESAQREAVEDILRQSQKMEAVGQLTGGLAHDFNNLLTGITGSLEVMRGRLAQGRTAELERYISAAMASANRAAALTHRLLAFSRRQTLNPKPVLVNDLIIGMMELLQRTVGPMITIQTVLPTTVGAILCDPNQLENALLNLALNARDAMLEGGNLTIHTVKIEVEEAFGTQRDMRPGSYVAISVIDTGLGMASEVIARAFDPFFTTKPTGEGTGLGLSMIYGFAKQSGGQVWIHSTEGAGTTVRIYLPSYQGIVGADLEPGIQAALPQPAEPGETVLVVDDEPVIRLLIIEVLEELGYATLEAADGRSALRQLETGGRIDLLVTDVGLPGGMNGRQLADAARGRRSGLKVLFITGFAANAAIGNGFLEPGMDVMTKPFTMNALASKVRTMINTTTTRQPIDVSPSSRDLPKSAHP